MTAKRISINKTSELDAYFPEFSKRIWPFIKKDCQTRQRCPKSVQFTDVANRMYLGDYDIGRRFVVNLETYTITPGIHVSAGENAIMNQKGQDAAVEVLPKNMALISCGWNDYYRTFSMDIQVAPGTLRNEPELISGGESL